MQPAGFIARLTGPFLFVIGVGVLLNEANYSAMLTEATHSPTLIYISGVLTLPLGLAILNVYRAWTADWRVIVTVLGWLLVIGGVIRIVLPQFTATLATTLNFHWPDGLRRRKACVGQLSQFRGVSVSLVDRRI
jgi:hypothetical protein